MAITAALNITESSVYVNQGAHAVVIVSNSGGSDVQVRSAYPKISSTGSNVPPATSSAAGVIDLSTFSDTNIPAGGTLELDFGLNFFASSLGLSGTGTYTVGCAIYTSTGGLVEATTDTITVNPIPQPSQQD